MAMATVSRIRTRARRSGREIRTGPLLAPSVAPLVLWCFVPLAVTLWFSLLHYNLLDPITRFVGFANYSFLLTDPSLTDALWNTVALVVGVLVASIVFGCLFAVLFDQVSCGRSVARLLIIAPFFVMPTVSALIWKNLLDASGQRPVCLHHALAASRRHRLVRQLAVDLGRHHRRLAVGAVRHAHPSHRRFSRSTASR